jgi:hypothetical protein
MKVETNLKSGALLDSAASAAQQMTGSAGNYLSQASQQAKSLTSSVVNKTTAVWNALVS